MHLRCVVGEDKRYIALSAGQNGIYDLEQECFVSDLCPDKNYGDGWYGFGDEKILHLDQNFRPSPKYVEISRIDWFRVKDKGYTISCIDGQHGVFGLKRKAYYGHTTKPLVATEQ